MRQKHSRLELNPYTISTLALAVVLVATLGVIIMKHDATDAVPRTKLTMGGVAVVSQFTFPGLTGWRQGATNETSMTLSSNNRTCFTSIQHKIGMVDVTAILQKTQAKLAISGYTSAQLATPTVAIQTNLGTQQYKLHQYSVTSQPGTTRVQAGQEFGYILFANGYLEVQGYCNTANELATTLPALQAIKFDEIK
jgi:hypothetical protein